MHRPAGFAAKGQAIETVAGEIDFSAVPHLRERLTKKIHASRSAAADLSHALACGYARGSGGGLAVAGPGILPAPRRGSHAGRFGRDVISGVRAC